VLYDDARRDRPAVFRRWLELPLLRRLHRFIVQPEFWIERLKDLCIVCNGAVSQYERIDEDGALNAGSLCFRRVPSLDSPDYLWREYRPWGGDFLTADQRSLDEHDCSEKPEPHTPILSRLNLLAHPFGVDAPSGRSEV
jgi:hypothetical protein